MNPLTLSEVRSKTWDTIIVGAGMGGGMVARRLAEQGVSVLILEQGLSGYTKEQSRNGDDISHPEARRLRGMLPGQVEARLDGIATRFFGPYGAGVGGSSVFYAAALERPERHDLDETPDFPHPTGGWPVGFDAFQPYFEAATEMLSLRGTQDPLSKDVVSLKDPLPMTPADAALIEQMQDKGLHPYRQHLAIRYGDECRACFGEKCPWDCKMDGRSAGIKPALKSGNASLLTDCRVRGFLDDGDQVTGLEVACGSDTEVLTAKRYVLCAGALASPTLLLASQSRAPEGCANSSGWVGRGLMFHLNEIFSLWPKRGTDTSKGFGKTISFRDLYTTQGERLGLVQSMGLEASYGNILVFMQRVYDQSFLRRFQKPRGLLRIPAMIASRLFGSAGTFVGIMEDMPYPDNRVVLNKDDPNVLTFQYKFNKELLTRRRLFRRTIRKAFRGHRLFLSSVQPTLNYGHPVGTLRFGEDPKTSVLRPDCRTHDLNNLYVADSSFMPSALGVNPSLTIAANALRVGDIIAADLGASKEEGADVTTI